MRRIMLRIFASNSRKLAYVYEKMTIIVKNTEGKFLDLFIHAVLNMVLIVNNRRDIPITHLTVQ